MYRIFFSTLLVLIFIGCNENSSIRHYYVVKTETNKINSNNSTLSKEALTYNAPEDWVESTGSSMRIASYTVPYNGGFGDLSVIRLGGDAGGIVANVNRWRGQLNLPPVNKENINKITFFGKGNSASYKWFKIINDNEPTSAFLCAILPEKNTTLFIKLNLPIAAITEVESEFLDFCSSITILE